MPYVSPFGLTGSYVALVACIIISLFKNFQVFTYSSQRTYSPDFDYKNFITGYLGIPIYLGMIFGHKVLMKSQYRRPETVDLYSGKKCVDEEVVKISAQGESNPKNDARDGRRFYRRYVAWLF